MHIFFWLCPNVLYIQCTVTIIFLFCAYFITADASNATLMYLFSYASFIQLHSRNSTPVLSVLSGYLSCCRFIDDNQIITSSGDTTWWAKHRRVRNTFSWANLCLNAALSAPVLCGTSRRVSRPRFSRATAATSWVCPCRPTSAPLCREPAMPQSSCGTSGTACAGRPSQATSRTSTPSVWVCSGQLQCLICIFIHTVLLCGITDAYFLEALEVAYFAYTHIKNM